MMAYQEEDVMYQPASRNQTGNRLLDRLPPQESDRLLPLAETVSLRQLEELHQQDGPLPHVYFPKSGVLSSVIALGDGRIVEAATIGNEGMVDIPALLGLDFSTATATSQVPGESLRIPTPPFVQALRRSGPLERMLRRYIAFSLRSAYQAVACNALHSAEERMCRWLLTTQDRVGQAEFLLTQEFLAQMLGVRRQTIQVVAGTLQTAGLITYRRGLIRVLDREGLEAATCECYAIIKALYDRIVQ
jgi:CRP-like cAMP-binding protein